jgi:hypothetical protein
MSAVAEERFGSSSVQRSSVPAGTTTFCAFVLACPNKNTATKIKHPKIRHMVFPPDFAGWTARSEISGTGR